MTWFSRWRKQPGAAARHDLHCPACQRQVATSDASHDELVLCECGALLDLRDGRITVRDPADIESSARIVPLSYRPQTASTVKQTFFLTRRDAEAHARTVMKFAKYMTRDVLIVGLDEKDSGRIYEVYHSSSRVAALAFLEKIPVVDISPLYYIVVETPFGNVGKDLDGIYDEEPPKPR